MKRLCFFVAFSLSISLSCVRGAELPRSGSVRDLVRKSDSKQRLNPTVQLIQKVVDGNFSKEEKTDILQLLFIASENQNEESSLYKNALRAFKSDIPQLSPPAMGETAFYITTYPTLPLSDSLSDIIEEKKARQIAEIKKNILGTKKGNFNYRIKRDDEKIEKFLQDPNLIRRSASQPLIDKLIKQQVDTIGKKINEDPNPTPDDRAKDLNLLGSYKEKTSNPELQQQLEEFTEEHTLVKTPEELGIVVEEAAEPEAAPLTLQQEQTANRSKNSPDSTLVLWQENPVVQQALEYYQQNKSQVDAAMQPQSPRKQPEKKVQKKVVVPEAAIEVPQELPAMSEVNAPSQAAAGEMVKEENVPGQVEVDYERIPDKGNLFNDYDFPSSIQSEWKGLESKPETAWSLSDFISRMWSGIKSWRWW